MNSFDSEIPFDLPVNPDATPIVPPATKKRAGRHPKERPATAKPKRWQIMDIDHAATKIVRTDNVREKYLKAAVLPTIPGAPAYVGRVAKRLFMNMRWEDGEVRAQVSITEMMRLEEISKRAAIDAMKFLVALGVITRRQLRPGMKATIMAGPSVEALSHGQSGIESWTPGLTWAIWRRAGSSALDAPSVDIGGSALDALPGGALDALATLSQVFQPQEPDGSACIGDRALGQIGHQAAFPSSHPTLPGKNPKASAAKPKGDHDKASGTRNADATHMPVNNIQGGACVAETTKKKTAAATKKPKAAAVDVPRSVWVLLDELVALAPAMGSVICADPSRRPFAVKAKVRRYVGDHGAEKVEAALIDIVAKARKKRPGPDKDPILSIPSFAKQFDSVDEAKSKITAHAEAAQKALDAERRREEARTRQERELAEKRARPKTAFALEMEAKANGSYWTDPKWGQVQMPDTDAF